MLEPSILTEMLAAEENAWKSLGRYKFVMFGYWAGVWVHLARIARTQGHRTPNPFSGLVNEARVVIKEKQ